MLIEGFVKVSLFQASEHQIKACDPARYTGRSGHLDMNIFGFFGIERLRMGSLFFGIVYGFLFVSLVQ